MIAHVDVRTPVMHACKPVVRTAGPCFVTVRTVRANGTYREHRVVLRPVAAVVVSGFAQPITASRGFAAPPNGVVVGGQTLAPGA